MFGVIIDLITVPVVISALKSTSAGPLEQLPAALLRGAGCNSLFTGVFSDVYILSTTTVNQFLFTK